MPTTFLINIYKASEIMINKTQEKNQMEGEVESFFKVWILAIISFAYCFYFSAKLPKGMLRFISLTPVFTLFLYLPITVSSPRIVGLITFSLAWLGNFKLILFAFNQPPLTPPPPSVFRFICLASLPIKPKTTTPYHRSNNISHHLPTSILVAIKVVILALLHHSYNYKQHLHKNAVQAMFCVQMYIEIEFILALVTVPARAIYGLDLEPQFNEPYLATSLQDFWGRRWNLMATGILRPTVYYPIRRISAPVLGPMWASLLAVVASFLVSGLMHELLHYYWTRMAPTWEVTCFFMLHGVALAVEVAVKTVVPQKMRLHRAVSGPLTLGFVVSTGVWLILPQLARNGVDERIREDYSKLVYFLKGLLPS